MARRAAIIINPISGTGGTVDGGRARAERAAAMSVRHGLDADVFLTERQSHAFDLARAAQTRGAPVVVAWGGDGTVNEVASALVRTPAALGIVPAGSGNGLARELGIPCDVERAFAIALGATMRMRMIDAGELDGRLFFNVAGLGLDACVAHAFAADGLRRRGVRRYAALALRALATYEPETYDIEIDGTTQHVRAVLVAIANSRQYGSGAVIAPRARLDDGRLDAVVVSARSLTRALWQLPKLFTGQVHTVPGVTARSAARITVSSGRPLLYHVDGEPHLGGTTVTAVVHPLALQVRVPGEHPAA